MFSELFNETSLRYPEIHTDPGHLLSYLVMYQHLALPEYLDDIKNRVMKKYFPTGKMEDDSHSNAVKVRMYNMFLYSIIHYLIQTFTSSVSITF